MFSGYGFFDYKYNIPGYEGQDYNGMGRYIYLGVSVGLLLILLFLFRNAKKETVLKYLRISGIAITALYLIKTTWESIYDITTGRGFNWYLLPFDTCSIIMWTALLAGFGKGIFKKAGESWIATGGIVGGVSNLLFLQALKYYPFFTFGAFYSMIWHFYMVFTGLFLWVTGYVKPAFSTLIIAFAFHLIVSAIVIPMDYIWEFDFMLYRTAGGVPFFEGVSEKLAASGYAWVTTPMMVAVYFACFALITGVAKLVSSIVFAIRPAKTVEQQD